MNGMAGRLSAFDETPDHFVDWLRHNVEELSRKPLCELRSHYALRQRYGDYLRGLLGSAGLPSPFGATIEVTRDKVTEIRLREGGDYIVRLEHCSDLVVDGVVLAHGHLTPRKVCADSWAECMEDPWNVEALQDLSRDARLLILGTGQTMMEVGVLLGRLQHRGQIYAISRRGLIAQPHAEKETQYALNLEELPHDLNGLVRYIRRTAREWVNGGGDWRAVVNALRPYTQKLWMRLSLKEKQRFLEHVAPYWRIHRTRVPPETSNAVQALVSSGRLQYFAGRILSIERRRGALDVVLCPRGARRTRILEVDRLINCSGPSYDYRNAESPLMTQLLGSGIIACHPVGVGLNVAPNGAIINSSGETSETMFAVGPPCKGTLFEITVIREIRRQAREVAGDLAAALLLAQCKRYH